MKTKLETVVTTAVKSMVVGAREVATDFVPTKETSPLAVKNRNGVDVGKAESKVSSFEVDCVKSDEVPGKSVWESSLVGTEAGHLKEAKMGPKAGVKEGGHHTLPLDVDPDVSSGEHSCEKALDTSPKVQCARL